MRNILSCHSALEDSSSKEEVYNLYKFYVDNGISLSEDLRQGLEFSIHFYDSTKQLPSKAQLVELGVNLKDVSMSQSDILHHCVVLREEAKKRIAKLKLIRAASCEDRSELLNQLDEVRSEIAFCQDEDDVVFNSADMSIDSLLDSGDFDGEGCKTGIKELDGVARIKPGVTTVVCAGPSMGKSLFADNFAYLNSVLGEQRILYMTLEVVKTKKYMTFLSRHSYQLDPQQAIPSNKIFNNMLTDDERKYLREVESDLKSKLKRKLRFLDVSDGVPFSPAEFDSLLEYEYRKEPFDIFIMDYIQLIKYSSVKGLTDMELMNKIVSIIRQKTVSIGGKYQVASLILSQANREGIAKARKNQGAYDLKALAEVNELERGAQVALFLYLDDVLQASNEIKFQMLKNREGPKITTPGVTFIDPAYSVIGETNIYNDVFSSDNLSLISGGVDSSTFGSDDLLVF